MNIMALFMLITSYIHHDMRHLNKSGERVTKEMAMRL